MLNVITYVCIAKDLFFSFLFHCGPIQRKETLGASQLVEKIVLFLQTKFTVTFIKIATNKITVLQVLNTSAQIVGFPRAFFVYMDYI